jgi:hypothetical protein
MTPCMSYLQGARSAASAERESAGEILNPTRRAKELKAGCARSLERAALSVEVPCQQRILTRNLEILVLVFQRHCSYTPRFTALNSLWRPPPSQKEQGIFSTEQGT